MTLDPRQIAARLVPAGGVLTFREFELVALTRGFATDAVSTRSLLARLKDAGVLRVHGSVPNASISRPAVPEAPRFTSTGQTDADVLNAHWTIEALRRENQILRDRLAAVTGGSSR